MNIDGDATCTTEFFPNFTEVSGREQNGLVWRRHSWSANLIMHHGLDYCWHVALFNCWRWRIQKIEHWWSTKHSLLWGQKRGLLQNNADACLIARGWMDFAYNRWMEERICFGQRQRALSTSNPRTMTRLTPKRRRTRGLCTTDGPLKSIHQKLWTVRIEPETCERQSNGYLEEPRLPRTTADMYAHWHRSRHPLLEAVARKHSSAPPTGMPSERLFSAAGRPYADRRDLLGCDAEKLLFLNCNIRLFEFSYLSTTTERTATRRLLLQDCNVRKLHNDCWGQ